MRDSKLRSPFRLRLGEVSALCVRHDSRHGDELLAVGDEDYVVLTARLRGDELEDQGHHKLGDVLEKKLRETGSKSEWEAMATDGEGRVFVVREDTATVVVFSRGLRKQVHAIDLQVEQGPDRRARLLLEGDNRGPEGMLLLTEGHLLVVKQRKPVLLIEFGPRRDNPLGWGKQAHLRREDAFELSDGGRTKLFPLRSWKLHRDHEEVVESANDLALDDEGRLHAISSRSRCVYDLVPGSDDDAVEAPNRWRLPDDIEASGVRKAEGLAFEPTGRPLVALDSRKGDNTFRLERLPR
jgi:hypothetical protein